VGAEADHGEEKRPRYLALRPLYPELQSRAEVETAELTPDGELSGRTISFREQDVEPWGRLLLADVDLFTSAPYATFVKEHNPELLEPLLEVKGKLAGALAEGLAPLFAVDGDEKAAAEGREAAIRALREGAATGLVAAYEVGTIVQDDAPEPSPAKAPTPLRAQPPLPRLVEQTAAATHDEAHPPLRDLSKWTFGVTYLHEQAAQDEVFLTVTADPGEERDPDLSSAPATSSSSSPDLAEALAAYAFVAPQLKELIDPSPDPLPQQTDNRKLLTAFKVMGTFAGAAAEAWARHWAGEEPAPPVGRQDAPAGESRRFRIVAEHREGEEGEDVLEALTLTLEEGAGPTPGGEPPAVKVVEGVEELVELDVKEVEPEKQWRYEPGAGKELALPGGLRLQLEWPDLNVAATSQAKASLWARRNANLAPGLVTNPAFVMSTATVTAASPATPLLQWIGEWVLDGELEQALRGGLEALFEEGTDLFVALNLSYRYQLDAPRQQAADSDFTTVLPVGLISLRLLAPAEVAKGVAEVAGKWRGEVDPPAKGAEWLVSLRATTSEDAGSRPLFVLDHLAIPLGDGS